MTDYSAFGIMPQSLEGQGNLYNILLCIWGRIRSKNCRCDFALISNLPFERILVSIPNRRKSIVWTSCNEFSEKLSAENEQVLSLKLPSSIYQTAKETGFNINDLGMIL